MKNEVEMNNNCITRFEVSNFKKFDNLVVENLGQVNLITGDNNVGKSTLLEALLCNEDNLRWIKYLHLTLSMRRINLRLSDLHSKEPKFPIENYLTYILRDINKKLTCIYLYSSGTEKKLELEYKSIENVTTELLNFRKDNYSIANVKHWVAFYNDSILTELQWLHLDDKEVNYNSGYWPYITFNAAYDEDLHFFLDVLKNEQGIIDYNDKQQIIKLLSIWIDDVVDYEVRMYGQSPIIGIATKSNSNYRAITTFGDGVQKFFRYILEMIYANKRNEPRIMIDEIDTGVHYLRMKDQWKAIFELSKQTGIQIFATTHSMDSIKAFVEAGEEMAVIKNDLRLIELEEFTNKSGSLVHTAKTYNHEMLKYNLETETNIRGGDVWR